MHALLDIKEYENDGTDDDNKTFQGGYSADQLIDLLKGNNSNSDTIVLDGGGGGDPIYPDGLRELLKDLYVPIGLFTQIKPCSTRSFSHDGTCITDSMFNELDNITSVTYKLGGTRKPPPIKSSLKTKKRHL